MELEENLLVLSKVHDGTTPPQKKQLRGFLYSGIPNTRSRGFPTYRTSKKTTRPKKTGIRMHYTPEHCNL